MDKEKLKKNRAIFKRFLKEIGLYHEFCRCLKIYRGGKDPFGYFDFEESFYTPSNIILHAFEWDISKFKQWYDIYNYLVMSYRGYDQLLDEGTINAVRYLIHGYDK